MADALGVTCRYVMINQDIEGYKEFVKLTETGRAELPLCVTEDGEVTEGIKAGVVLVRKLGENNEG